ncbi:MAG TPA: cytochrome c family protein [Caulobacteraceae bacterium]|jgi:cytochrome c|nr:cytochrome c family protein [Caulobacteraceae bacterium]
MRTSVLALAAAALELAACGQNSSSSDQTAAPPPPPTPDQVKTLLAQLPAPYNTGDVANGKIKFTQCAACHTTAQGGPNLTGPNLYGIFGRKAGTHDGFAYSDALKSTGWTWDAARIDTWITNPHAVLATTKMSFVGLNDPKDRRDVIAYLKTATSPLP